MTSSLMTTHWGRVRLVHRIYYPVLDVGPKPNSFVPTLCRVFPCPPIILLTDMVSRSRLLAAHGLTSCLSVRTQPLTATGAPSQTSTIPYHTRQFRIKTTTLEERLGVIPIVQSYHRRLLGWAGAVLRMPMDRLPRQMLTAWIPHPRAVGSERNWGQAFNIALKANGLDTSIKKLTEIAHLPRSADRNNPNPSTWLQTTKQGLSPRT